MPIEILALNAVKKRTPKTGTDDSAASGQAEALASVRKVARKFAYKAIAKQKKVRVAYSEYCVLDPLSVSTEEQYCASTNWKAREAASAADVGLVCLHALLDEHFSVFNLQ